MTMGHALGLRRQIKAGTGTHETNRALGLQYPNLRPLEQLDVWSRSHAPGDAHDDSGAAWDHYQHGVGLVLGVGALLFGVMTGVTLLRYNGTAPVNAIYFLTVAVLIPLLTMGLAIFAMMRAHSNTGTIIRLAPAAWLGRMITKFFPAAGSIASQMPLEAPAANWWVIERAQMMAFWFALGLLVALMGLVVTRDMAFVWSTTLRVEPAAFHRLIAAVAWPWHAGLPSAVPSVELVAQSQYYRLGGTLDPHMVRHAARLGEWWKFLAMATLTYGVVLRAIVWMMASIGLHRAVRRMLLDTAGAQQIVREMNTPLLATISEESEAPFVQLPGGYPRTIQTLECHGCIALGWAIAATELQLALDALHLDIRQTASVGGSRSPEEDTAIIAPLKGTVLFVVKGWEPPTMEWVDVLIEVAARTDRVVVAPIGTVESSYVLSAKSLAVWERKLHQIDRAEVWLWMR